MISQIFRAEYPMPVKAKKAINSEYWVPYRELLQDPALWVIIEGRVHEELARYYRQIQTQDFPEFDPSMIRGRWFSYDWDTKSFSGAPSDVPPPEEWMRG